VATAPLFVGACIVLLLLCLYPSLSLVLLK